MGKEETEMRITEPQETSGEPVSRMGRSVRRSRACRSKQAEFLRRVQPERPAVSGEAAAFRAGADPCDRADSDWLVILQQVGYLDECGYWNARQIVQEKMNKISNWAGRGDLALEAPGWNGVKEQTCVFFGQSFLQVSRQGVSFLEPRPRAFTTTSPWPKGSQVATRL